MGELVGPLVGGIAAGGASAATSRLFGGGGGGGGGGGFLGLQAGGLQFGTDIGGQVVQGAFAPGDNARFNAVGGLSNLFNRQAGEIGALRGLVRPGFGKLTEASRSVFQQERLRLKRRFDLARTRSRGNLRENLARRRVLGSSFAQDAEARSESEFVQAEAEFLNELTAQQAQAEAQSFLQELALTNDLINQEFSAQAQAFNTVLDEFNLQAQIGLTLATGGAVQLGANSRVAAQLAADSASGSGLLAGFLARPFINQVGQSAGNLASGFFNSTPSLPAPSSPGPIGPGTETF